MNEIKRCKKIKLVDTNQVVQVDDLTAIHVIVNNYEDYLELCRPWPADAFKSGKEIEPLPPNLQVIILNVDPKVYIYQESNCIQKLEENHGLINVERIMQGKDRNEPSNRLKATPKTLIYYITVLKEGILFNTTGKTHLPYPNIIHPKICRECGSLNHREKDC